MEGPTETCCSRGTGNYKPEFGEEGVGVTRPALTAARLWHALLPLLACPRQQGVCRGRDWLCRGGCPAFLQVEVGLTGKLASCGTC